MTILAQLPAGAMLGRPFADYLNVTVPKDYAEEVKPRLLALIEMLGPSAECSPGQFSLFNAAGKPTGGSFLFRPRGKVLIIGASGVALAALRDAGLFGRYLEELAFFPHRVSMLHTTQDYVLPEPWRSIEALKDAAFNEEIYLTRKKVLRASARALLAPNEEGQVTGTLYLGNRKNADVWAKVYDKQHERLSKGFPDPGPIVRVEIAIQSAVGATLKDAYDPYSLFFHFASRSLVEAPGGVEAWEPCGEGYVLGPRPEVLMLDRLQRISDFSLDLQRWVALAVEAYGDKAADVLGRQVAKKCKTLLAASLLT
jgi:hypothetical protein